jgi:hypothetical protein
MAAKTDTKAFDDFILDSFPFVFTSSLKKQREIGLFSINPSPLLALITI